MPTYEYRCNACLKEFEYQQRMSDPDLVTCEACGADKLEKLISWTAFQTKGSSWRNDLLTAKTPQEARQIARDATDRGRPPKKEKPEAQAAATAAAPAAPMPAESAPVDAAPATAEDKSVDAASSAPASVESTSAEAGTAQTEQTAEAAKTSG